MSSHMEEVNLDLPTPDDVSFKKGSKPSSLKALLVSASRNLRKTKTDKNRHLGSVSSGDPPPPRSAPALSREYPRGRGLAESDGNALEEEFDAFRTPVRPSNGLAMSSLPRSA